MSPNNANSIELGRATLPEHGGVSLFGNKVLLPENVGAFCARQGISANVELAIALVRQCFPSLSDLNVRVDDDPEEHGEWVVVEVVLREQPDRFLDAYNRCASLWADQLPSQALSMIRLSYSLL